MRLYFTEAEQAQLRTLCFEKKYGYAIVLVNLLDNQGTAPAVTLDEADAWEWKDSVDGEKSFLPHSQGSLRTKLATLYDRIQ